MARPLGTPLPASLQAPLQTTAALQDLHPALWRAHQLGHQRVATWASGHAALDTELPGAGWPAHALTELLLPHPGVGEVRLLAPVLARVQTQQRCVMLLDPPASLCAWAWAGLGLSTRHLVVVQGAALKEVTHKNPHSTPHDTPHNITHDITHNTTHNTLWALEHALKSGLVGAVLAWLPQRLPPDALRRLQLAAQAHDGPAFLLRHSAARAKPSPAPLRLLLAPGAPDTLHITLLKRRGPLLLRPISVALTPVLSAPALARALRAAPLSDVAAAGDVTDAWVQATGTA